MKRNLSSKWTLPAKIFNFLLAALPVVFITASFRELISSITPEKIAAVVAAVAFMIFFSWVNSRLKFVSIDENNLYVSRLFREKTIPFREVGEVRLTTIGFVWVAVRFKSKTIFGQKIFFMPTIEKSFVLSMQRYHPVVEELKNSAQQAVAL